MFLRYQASSRQRELIAGSSTAITQQVLLGHNPPRVGCWCQAQLLGTTPAIHAVATSSAWPPECMQGQCPSRHLQMSALQVGFIQIFLSQSLEGRVSIQF